MRRPLLCLSVLIVCIVGIWMNFFHKPPWEDETISPWLGKEIQISGQIYKKEIKQLYGEEIVLYYLKTILVHSNEEIHSIKSNLICEVTYPEIFRLGNRLYLEGKIKLYSNSTNPGEFDLANYYHILGIGGKFETNKIVGVKLQIWKIQELLWNLKEKAILRIEKNFPEDVSPIMKKILLGDGSSLDNEIKDMYQRNGIIHILSISGLHITMIGLGIYKGIRTLGGNKIFAAILGGVIIVTYGIMIGFSVSVFRAIGMYLVKMLGELIGRTYDMLSAMGLLAIIMVIQNPKYLFHSGFLMSFSSIYGIGILYPTIYRQSVSKKMSLKKCWYMGYGSFMASLSITLMNLPIQLSFFYEVPFYAPICNILIIPFMGLLMLFGFIFLFFPILKPLMYGTSFILQWFELVCNFFEKLPFHQIIIGKPSLGQVFIFYLIIFLSIYGYKKKTEKMMIFRMITLTLGVVFITLPLNRIKSINFLDVGQGDCILIQTKQRKTFLFDGGSSSRGNMGENVLIPYLKYKGISKIAAVFVSHPDNDHVNGIVELLENKEGIFIETIFFPDVGETSLLELEEIVDIAIANLGRSLGRIDYVSASKYLEMDEIKILCLHPTKGYEGNANEFSASFYIEFYDYKILLTGDVEGNGEVLLKKELVDRNIEELDILKVAHHGSKNSTTEAFLSQMNIKTAIISASENNTYGHPHNETMERLHITKCKILQTSKEGCIEILIK